MLALSPACDGEDADDDLGDGDSESGDGGDGDQGSGGSGNIDDTYGESNGDGDPLDTDDPDLGCAEWSNAQSCLDAPGCEPIVGFPLKADNQDWCTAIDPEFIGCTESAELCPGLTKILCDEDGQAWTTTGCVPNNLMVCDPPGDITGECDPGSL